MGRKRKHVDYRQLYKDYYGIEFGEDMAVHHIDFDRSNNDVSNLLLLPERLHAKYHFHITQLGGKGTGYINSDMRIDDNVYRIMALKGLADALEEIAQWVETKNTMDMMKSMGMKWTGQRY